LSFSELTSEVPNLNHRRPTHRRNADDFQHEVIQMKNFYEPQVYPSRCFKECCFARRNWR